MKHWSHHPGVRTGEDLTIGERAADACVRCMGSWTFVAIQTVIVAAWIVLNLVAFTQHWDPYPFILLNLGFSTQAAYAAPLILLAQRRNDDRTAEVATHTLHNTTTGNAAVAQLSVDMQRLRLVLADLLPELDDAEQAVNECRA